MPISFNAVPSNLRVPFVAIEINNTQAQQGPALLPYSTLLIGQMTSGTASANTIYPVASVQDVITLAGRGSMLHRQALAYFNENKFTQTYIGVLADNGAGTAATATLTVTGPATAAGTLNIYIGGTHGLVQVAVANADSANTIATNIAAAINAAADLPVTASPSTNVVTVTFRHKGLVGNDLDIRLNYQDGDATPAGVSVAIVAMASGATNPVLTSLITAMGDTWFQAISMPYTDATSLTAMEAELNSRFGPMRMIDGWCVTCHTDTVSNLETLGDSRNNAHVSIVGVSKSPTPTYEVAASVLGQAALSAANDPAQPFQTLPLNWVDSPAQGDLLTLAQRNDMLFHGISTVKSVAGGVVEIERLITTYKTNAAGASDTSYLDVNTILNLLYLRFAFRNQIQTKYARHKLADDATRFGAGQAVITPSIGKAEALLWFRQMEEIGLVEDFDTFKANIVVERDGTNVNRLNWLLPPNLINQFIVGAVNLQFIL